MTKKRSSNEPPGVKPAEGPPKYMSREYGRRLRRRLRDTLDAAFEEMRECYGEEWVEEQRQEACERYKNEEAGRLYIQGSGGVAQLTVLDSAARG